MKKKEKKLVLKEDKDFIGYDGFNEELGIIKKGDLFIKPYELTVAGYAPDLPQKILDEQTELFYANGKMYVIYAVKADVPEDAAEKFKEIESRHPVKAISILLWFNLLTLFTGREELTEIPAVNKKKKDTVSSLIAPYNVKSTQKDIELTGKTGRTLLLTGFPSKIFPGFCSELLELSDKAVVSIHLKRMDIDLCLTGLSELNARPMRKSVMKDFLTKEKAAGRDIYDTSCYVFYRGEKDELDEFIGKLDRFLDKYLVGKSDLDYQQRRATQSTLPLCNNVIKYNRVLNLSDISALLPMSHLRDAKNMPSAVPYGKDIIQGDIKYSRLLNKENGAILSTNAVWAVEKAVQEISFYKDHVPEIVVLSDRDTDTSMFVPDGENMSEQMLSLDDAPDFMKQALVSRWAFNTIAINGSVSIRKMNVLNAAVGNIKGEHYLEDFIESIKDNDVKRSLTSSPCPRKFYFRAYERGNVGVIKALGDKALEREMGYALLFDSMPKNVMVYSLNTELLVNAFPQFRVKDGVIYTLLVGTSKTPDFLSDGPTGNVDHVYDDPTVREFLHNAEFLYIGEHKIAEKLKLNLSCPMSKEQRDVITEPARGNLLITKEVSYILTV